MDSEHTKYHVPSEESEILPNLLGLTKKEDIDKKEFEGVLGAARIIIDEVSNETTFDLAYIYRIHRIAFSELYEFAGELRTVNISKGGFVFPSAMYLGQTMSEFEKTMLLPLGSDTSEIDRLINDIAAIHAELLFIHPFREGNGRVARILADAMAVKYGMPLWDFRKIDDARMEEYIIAVQSAAGKDYEPMQRLFRLLA